MHDVLVGRHGYNVVSDRTALMCLVGLLGLITPRLILILMWLFSPEFVLQPFADLPIPNPIMLVLGLVVLPTTTLGYCWAVASLDGIASLSGLLVVVIGLLIDVGLIGNGRGQGRR